MRASCSHRIMLPRALRFIDCGRLLIPCRLNATAARTLPEPVMVKRFFALDLVFSLGILLFLSVFKGNAAKEIANPGSSLLGGRGMPCHAARFVAHILGATDAGL